MSKAITSSQNSSNTFVSGSPSLSEKRVIKFRGKSMGYLSTWIYGYYHFDKELNKHLYALLKNLYDMKYCLKLLLNSQV